MASTKKSKIPIEGQLYLEYCLKFTYLSFLSFELFKVNNRNTRKRCEICSKLTIKTPERRQ